MSAREIRRVPLESLTPDPEQPRKAFSEESLTGLARTLADGQLQPVLAYERDGALMLLDGERRWRAARMAGLDAIDVIVVAREEVDPEQVPVAALIANLQREDLLPVDKAQAIARLIELNGSAASEVAAQLGLSPATVSRLLALLKLPEAVQEQVNRGELAVTTALELARSEADVEGAAKQVVDRGLSRDSVAAMRKKGGGRTSARARPRVVAQLDGGRSITASGNGLDSLDELIAWLEELLAKARKARPRGMELRTFESLLRDESKVARRSGAGKSKTAGGRP